MIRARASGFTVVEIMIVLAVTGLLFLSAVALISGKTDQTEFDQAARAIQQQIQDSVSEVAAGQYASLNNFSCTVSGGSLTISPVSSPQGKNEKCAFLGKVMQFAVHNTHPEQFLVYPIAGIKEDAIGQQVAGLASLDPTVVALSSSTGMLEYGLHAAGMIYENNGSSPVHIGAVGFIYSLPSYDSSSGIASGTSQVDLYPIVNSALHQSKVAGESKINAYLENQASQPTPNPSGGVTICFRSGTTNQYAIITIGTNGNGTNNQLDVNLTISDTSPC
ncbi:MAG TPA: hypothetical protein VGS08_00905 [Candidatus Saccharimonadales bacterium]|nr:hypothetical protein [Candidatus Saccharimonadales bacterium]